MANNSIRIDQLHLRVRGFSREHPANLGASVAKQLASRLPTSTRAQNISALDVRLAIPIGTPAERLASIIAAGIARRIS